MNLMVHQCFNIVSLKGIEALRLSYLEDDKEKELMIPPLKIFVENNYKKYKIPEISIDQMTNIT